MHLFAISWGFEPDRIPALYGELLRTARGYPHIDPGNSWLRRPHPDVAAMGVSSTPKTTAPREYVCESDAAIVLFDGLPLVPSRRYEGHRASALEENWSALTATLEGRFICVRVHRRVPEIQLITDPLGVGQLYVWEAHGRSVVSNSAGLIQRFLDISEPDPVGVSMFLAMDWVGGERTLRRGVGVAPGGQQWRWKRGDPKWRRTSYWSVANDCPPPTRTVDDAVLDAVIEGIAEPVRAASAVTGTINAPITGGKDSRMLAAVLMGSGIRANYWTKGDPESRDVGIATEIAGTYGLPHRLANRPTQLEVGRDPTLDVAAEWPRITREFVLQTDGLASVFLVGNIQGQPDHVESVAVTLSAMCAESARAVEAQEYLCGRGASVERTARYLPYAETQMPRGLVRREAYAATRAAVRDWVRQAAVAGVDVRNLPVAFYLDERCRRWASNNPRELAQTEDKVLPFMMRPYVTNVLALQVGERGNHRLHRGVIRRMVPELEHRPPPDIPWRVSPDEPGRRRVAYNDLMAGLPYAARRAVGIVRDRIRPAVKRAPWSPYDEASWLEANLDDARESILSRTSSPLWAYLHRPMVEQLLAPSTDPRLRRLHQLPLFAAYTMFLYEGLEAELKTEPVLATVHSDIEVDRDSAPEK